MQGKEDPEKKIGTVYLVGAGPGDPGLLTLRAQELLGVAEVVFFDHLVHPDILQHCRGAELHYVGKVGHGDSVSQEEIEATLKRAAASFSRVVRLKGGDPFIFGRGGEEAEFLAGEGIPFEIVPGVTSAIAVPAYAGIPLTHREHATSVAFLTGHEDPDKAQPGPHADWAALGRMDTLVFLMGVKTLGENLKKLIEQGRDPNTPAAIIEWGTYARQRTVRGTLQNLLAQAERAQIQAPAVVVVGEVVRLSESLNWWERRPLSGRRILVTRAGHQAGPLLRGLRELGAEAVVFPTIEMAAPLDEEGLDRIFESIPRYAWILFTSTNAVDWFFKRYLEKSGDLRLLAGIRLGALGPATAARLRALGLMPDKIAEEFSGEGLARSFSERELKGQRVLIPSSDLAREEGPRLLREQGAEVEVVTVYRNLCPHYPRELLEEIFSGSPLDLLTFTSPSAVENFFKILKDTSYLDTLQKIPVAVIGPTTRQAAEKFGLKVISEATQASIPNFLKVIQDSL